VAERPAWVSPAWASRRTRYNGTGRPSLWRRLLPIAGLMLALPSGACSFSYQLGSLFGGEDKKPDVTSSISSNSAQVTPTASTVANLDGGSENDLVYARAAASEALSRDGKTVPWENPKTGARGTVTPLASAYTQDGFLCRDFLASYVRQGAESWLQGEGCRVHQGKWEIRAMRPWKKT
jgi:surface antigen